MANRKLEEQIEQLTRVAEAGPGPATTAALRAALGDRVNLVVAKAAKLAGQLGIRELIPDLLRAYGKLFEKPVERDPQCWGKNAIARALTELDHRESTPFLRGARHIQMEPVFGGRADTAPTLRGICLLGLVTCSDLRRQTIFRWLVDGMAEPAEAAHTVRLEAIRAVAQMEGDEAGLLLRLKARAGDREPPVMGQVFDSLLALEQDVATGFVADFLDGGDESVTHEAALSLGASKLPAAIDALMERLKQARDPDLRDVLMRALSASRETRAIEFLLDLVKDGRRRDAEGAIEALRLHHESPQIWSLVEAAAAEAGGSIQELLRDSPARSGWKGARADDNL